MKRLLMIAFLPLITATIAVAEENFLPSGPGYSTEIDSVPDIASVKDKLNAKADVIESDLYRRAREAQLSNSYMRRFFSEVREQRSRFLDRLLISELSTRPAPDAGLQQFLTCDISCDSSWRYCFAALQPFIAAMLNHIWAITLLCRTPRPRLYCMPISINWSPVALPPMSRSGMLISEFTLVILRYPVVHFFWCPKAIFMACAAAFRSPHMQEIGGEIRRDT